MKSIVIEKLNILIIEMCVFLQFVLGEVCIKVKLVGICGFDSYIYWGYNFFVKYFCVIGYEFFGVIDVVGDNVNYDWIGEWVFVDLVISCGYCYFCLVGKFNVCILLVVLGVYCDGGFSEYVVVLVCNVYCILDNIVDYYVVMVELFIIVVNVMG